jgi:hypothetical protein
MTILDIYNKGQKKIELVVFDITLFRPIAVLCGTDSIMMNIFHIQPECEGYFSW